MDWKGFVIIHDGGCTYEEKARRVEKMGAQALIIYEKPDMDIDMRIDHSSDSKYDGSGTSVSIPTFIVSQEDGKELCKLVSKNPNFDERVILKAEIEVI